MAFSIRTSGTRSVLLAALMVASGIASAGTSNTTMKVGLTLVAPGSMQAVPRVDGAVNADGVMGSQGASQLTLRTALEAAPRSERMLPARQPDGSRVLAVQY